MRAAVVRVSDNIVENIIVADASKDVPPREGAILVNVDDAVRIGWVMLGDTFVDPDPVTPPEPVLFVPELITPRQCRLLLLQQGLLAQAEAMVAASTDDVKITWEYALEFRRNDPLLTQFAANLQPPLTDAQLDQFFIAAAQL